MAPSVEQPSLTVLSGAMGGTVFVVDDSIDNVLIGSDPSCRFALPDTAVDPIHARLWIDLEGITVYDTNSPRGVYINDDRVQGQARLRNGDILWLGPPGDDQSVMLQCRLPGALPGLPVPVRSSAASVAAAAPAAEPEIDPDSEPTLAMMASDLAVEPTVSLAPVPVVTPEPTPEPPAVLAPDAIQPEPTVILAPDDAFIEPEPTVAMPPQHLEISEEDAPFELDPTATPPGAFEEPPATLVTGWDPSAGGISSAADPPWMQGARTIPVTPDSAATIASATIASAPAAPRREPEPPPAPAPKPIALPVAAASRPASPDARPARAPERPPAPKPRRPPPDEPIAPPPSRKGAPMGLLIGGGLLAAAAVAAGGWWMLTRSPAAPESGTAAPPPPVADAGPATLPPVEVAPDVSRPAPAAEVPVEEEVTIVPPPRAGMSPSPVPSRAPSATPPPTRVAAAPPPVTAPPAGPAPAVVAAAIVGRAETARRAGDLDAAAELFDQALRADPQNAAATSGKAAVTVARAAARKSFMPGRTVVQTQSAKADMAGFDTADVSVKKAPDFSGRIEFAVSPAKVKPGDNYAVQIYLVNEGKKAIKVSGVSVTTNLNGAKSARPAVSRVKEVGPSQRALLEEVPGVWPEEVTSWSAEVLVTANKGDSLKNLLTWK